MRDGFLKAAVVTPKIKVADCEYNTEQIIENMEKAYSMGARIIAFPELCITGYTCGDLFLQETLLSGAKEGLRRIIKASENKKVLVITGLPLMVEGKMYNVAAVSYNGRLLGIVPKINMPNYSEFYEARHFTPGCKNARTIIFDGEEVPFGSRIIFADKSMEAFRVAVEICEDLWVPEPPSGVLAVAGAYIIVNPSASDEATGKADFRRELVKSQSSRLMCAYLYADAGEGESTTDLVFSGHNIIAENGTVVREADAFTTGITISEIDLGRLVSERRRMTTYNMSTENAQYVYFESEISETELTRYIDNAPFVPKNNEQRKKRCSEITNIQVYGLKKRLEHTGCRHAVIGISGGLDSTLALLVTKKAFDLAGLDTKGIIAVTMPCFGTTDRTYNNAVSLIHEIGAEFKEIRINEAVNIHFKDIEHDASIHDVTYENSQARERTQILMDLANKYNGMVIGTGDMSELALGWATYNGDHMSMYGVNASVPKTLVRYLVAYFADEAKEEKLGAVLKDILDTPVSPELLPPVDGVISQKTEDLVGPYELHDFFLYYMMRFGYTPKKIYRMCVYAFGGKYDNETVKKWLKTFYRRFFSQQFKRSCLPDGPRVGSVAVSPRGDLRMPSDACASLWLKEAEELV